MRMTAPNLKISVYFFTSTSIFFRLIIENINCLLNLGDATDKTIRNALGLLRHVPKKRVI